MFGYNRSLRSEGSFGQSGSSRGTPYSTPPSSEQQPLELELESLVPPPRNSPRVARTSSGSLLSRRVPSFANIDAPTGCPDRGSRIARSVSKNVFRKRGKISYWVACFLGLVGMAVIAALLEGNSFVVQIGGVNTSKNGGGTTGPSSTDQELEHYNSHDHNSGGQQTVTTTLPPTAAPTMVPTQAVQHVSAVEHKAMNQSDKLTNSFTTWLDFDEQDPPPKQTHPKVGNATQFVKQWCDLTGTTWFPKQKDAWQTRAPYFLLPGAMYSGTAYLAAALHQHPSILPARTKELQFFHDSAFTRYITPRDEKTVVRQARYRRNAVSRFDRVALEKDASAMYFDATPGYLYFSSLIPRRILCVEPWVKLVLLLRNPVDRILEQYAHLTESKNLKKSLEEWIDEDLEIWNSVGLNSTENDKDEDLAWYEYTEQSKPGPIGRSAYAIQVRHWLQAFRASGRDPSKEILLVRTDDMAANPDAEYQRVLKFLNLSSYSHSVELPRQVSHQTRRISDETRQRLETFFLPHNRRLKKLMRTYGITTSGGD